MAKPHRMAARRASLRLARRERLRRRTAISGLDGLKEFMVYLIIMLHSGYLVAVALGSSGYGLSTEEDWHVPAANQMQVQV